MKINQTYYYQDELNDEFSGIERENYNIKDNFKYIHKNPFYCIAAFFVYQVIMRPVAFFYCKFVLHLKIVNKKVLKPYRHKGYFLYGNHTIVPGDAYIPNMLNSFKTNYVVVNSQNLAVRGTRNLLCMMGAFPIPSSLKGMRNFLNSMEKRLLNGASIVIYPEAHIWPYYTKIRHFKSTSFKYPAKFNDPCFSFTTTYQKRKHSDKPKVTVYVDGPFIAPNGTSEKDGQEYLAKVVYDQMVERAKNSTYACCTYIKKEMTND